MKCNVPIVLFGIAVDYDNISAFDIYFLSTIFFWI
jgi:hypothetical protein